MFAQHYGKTTKTWNIKLFIETGMLKKKDLLRKYFICFGIINSSCDIFFVCSQNTESRYND